MVDDSHAVGFMGENGRGTPELCGVMEAGSTLSPGRWARRWAARAAVTPADVRKSSIYCGSGHGHIYFPIPSRRPLLPRR